MNFDQSEYDIRCEWGEEGLKRLAPVSDALIIVDVMSFSTCVTMAVTAGASVYPHPFRDQSARERAKTLGAELAVARGTGLYSLSPQTMLKLSRGMKLVLPSRNGAVLSLAAEGHVAFAGCFRNARAVARAARRVGPKVAIIPAGERWLPSDALRPALEDWLGAGAIISYLTGSRSPEAEAACIEFQAFKADLKQILGDCSSGRELREKGFEADIDYIAALDVEEQVPILENGCFIEHLNRSQPTGSSEFSHRIRSGF